MNSALMLHRHARPAVAGSYLLGAVSGALVSVGALVVVSGLLSPLPTIARSVVAVGLLILLILHRVGILCLDLPQRAHQIPRETFAASPTAAAFRFAFELGTGVRTYITSVSPYALAVILVLCLPGQLGAAVLAAVAAATGYGLGRSMVVVSQAMSRRVAVDHPQRWLRTADLVALVAALAVAVAG